MTKIEGVPEGWELVRIGCLNDGEWFIGGDGKPCQFKGSKGDEFWPIIRRIEPICTWQHGVWKDSWIAEDKSGKQWVFSERPVVANSVWVAATADIDANWLNISRMLNPPKFRSDLPWTERIQQVGPTIEATLKEASNAQ